MTDTASTDIIHEASGATETESHAEATVPEVPRPRIRWGAIVWGAIVTLTATITLLISSDPDRRDGFAYWLGGLTPLTIGLIAVLVTGAVVLVLALLSVVNRAQQR